MYQAKNQGKGAAVRRGFQEVSKSIVIIQDADLEYNPSEYMILITPILENKADVVYGSRFLGGSSSVLYFWHCWGINSDADLQHVHQCEPLGYGNRYKAFHRSILERVHLVSDRFGFEPEFPVKVAKAASGSTKFRFPTKASTYAEGKKINWKDGVAAFWGSSNFTRKIIGQRVASSPLSIMFDVILYQPEIPPNTGNIIRLCCQYRGSIASRETAGLYAGRQAALLRAGLDYHEFATLTVHETWEICLERFADRTTIRRLHQR